MYSWTEARSKNCWRCLVKSLMTQRRDSRSCHTKMRPKVRQIPRAPARLNLRPNPPPEPLPQERTLDLCLLIDGVSLLESLQQKHGQGDGERERKERRLPVLMHTKGHQKKDEKQKHTKNRNDMDHGIVRRGRDLR